MTDIVERLRSFENELRSCGGNTWVVESAVAEIERLRKDNEILGRGMLMWQQTAQNLDRRYEALREAKAK